MVNTSTFKFIAATIALTVAPTLATPIPWVFTEPKARGLFARSPPAYPANWGPAGMQAGSPPPQPLQNHNGPQDQAHSLQHSDSISHSNTGTSGWGGGPVSGGGVHSSEPGLHISTTHGGGTISMLSPHSHGPHDSPFGSPALLPNAYFHGSSSHPHGPYSSLHPAGPYSDGDGGTNSPPPVVPNGPHPLAFHGHRRSSSAPLPSHPGSYNGPNGNNEITYTHPTTHSPTYSSGSGGNPFAHLGAYGTPWYFDSRKSHPVDDGGGSASSSPYSYGPGWGYPSSSSSEVHSAQHSPDGSVSFHSAQHSSDGSVSFHSAHNSNLNSPEHNSY